MRHFFDNDFAPLYQQIVIKFKAIFLCLMNDTHFFDNDFAPLYQIVIGFTLRHWEEINK